MSDLKMVDGRVLPLTDTERQQRVIDQDQAAAAAAAWEVPKLLLVERLRDAGLLRLAAVALKLDAPLDKITDAELALRERWMAASVLASNDADVRLFLAAIGGKPDQLLRRP